MGARLGARLRRPPGSRRASAKRVMPAPTGSRDSQRREERESDAGSVYRARAAGAAARCSIAAARGSPPVTSRLRPSQLRLPSETLPQRPPPSFRPFPGLRRAAGPGLRVRGVSAIPGRSRSRRPEPSRSGHRCRFASLSRFPDLCPRPVPPTGQRPPASCAPPPSCAAPLPSEPQSCQ